MIRVSSASAVPALQVGAERSLPTFVSRATAINSQDGPIHKVAYEVRTDVPADNTFLNFRAGSPANGSGTLVGRILDLKA
jgi:hypothetical protein